AARAAGAVAVSHAVAQDVRALLPKLSVAVVANAIDTHHFAPGPTDSCLLDKLAGLSPLPAAVRIGLVATYATWKGHDVFLDAATQAPRIVRDRPLRFFIVGGPIYHTRGSQWSAEELRARAPALFAEGRAGLIDFQPDPGPIYRALDIVVHA